MAKRDLYKKWRKAMPVVIAHADKFRMKGQIREQFIKGKRAQVMRRVLGQP